VALLATCAPPPLVRDQWRRLGRLRLRRLGRLGLAHNISLLLGKQLVLEPKVGVALDEGLPRLPGRIIWREPLPLHEELPGAMLKTCPAHPSRSEDHPAVMNGRQWRRGRRRVAVEGLQQPHMEDIVEARPLWKLQVIGHLPNALDHLERTCVAGAELALGTALQRVDRPV